jgi:hypothetical protein
MAYLFHDSMSDEHSGDSDESYDTAQICLNGHCINSSSIDFPQHNQDYCGQCGQPTIRTCKKCNAPIRGYYRNSTVIGGYEPPAFCNKCGAAFPWTETRINTAIEMAGELENLDRTDKETLVSSINDIVRDSPKTPLAAGRFKKIMSKAGTVATDSMKKIIIEIASESAKKILWPNG